MVADGVYHTCRAAAKTDIYQMGVVQDIIQEGFSMNGIYPLINVTLHGDVIGKILDPGSCDPSLIGWMVVWPPVPLRADAILNWYNEEVYMAKQKKAPVRGYDLDGDVDKFIDNINNCVIDVIYIGVVVPSSKVQDGVVRGEGEYFDTPEDAVTKVSPTFYEYRFVLRTMKGIYNPCPDSILEHVMCKPLLANLSTKITRNDLKRRIFMHDRRFLLPLIPPSLLDKAFSQDWPEYFRKQQEDEDAINEIRDQQIAEAEREKNLFIPENVPDTIITHRTVDSYFTGTPNDIRTSSLKKKIKKMPKKQIQETFLEMAPIMQFLKSKNMLTEQPPVCITYSHTSEPETIFKETMNTTTKVILPALNDSDSEKETIELPRSSGPVTQAKPSTSTKSVGGSKKTKASKSDYGEPKTKTKRSRKPSGKDFIDGMAEEDDEDEDDSDFDPAEPDEDKALKKKKVASEDLMSEDYVSVKQLPNVEPDGLPNDIRGEYYQYNLFADSEITDFVPSLLVTKKFMGTPFKIAAEAWGKKYYEAYKKHDCVRGEEIKSDEEPSDEEPDNEEDDGASVMDWVNEGDRAAEEEALALAAKNKRKREPDLPNLGDDTDHDADKEEADMVGSLQLQTSYVDFGEDDVLKSTPYQVNTPTRTSAAQGVDFAARKEAKKNKKSVTQSADGKVKAVLPEDDVTPAKEKVTTKSESKEQKKESSEKKDKSEKKKDKSEKKKDKSERKKDKSSEPDKKKRKKSSEHKSESKKEPIPAEKKEPPKKESKPKEPIANGVPVVGPLPTEMGRETVASSVQRGQELLSEQLKLTPDEFTALCNKIRNHVQKKSETEVELRSKEPKHTFLEDSKVQSLENLVFVCFLLMTGTTDFQMEKFFSQFSDKERLKSVIADSIDFLVSGGGQYFGYKTKHDLKKVKPAPKKSKVDDFDFD